MVVLQSTESHAADGFYCGRTLIKEGDLSHYVAQVCPKPFFVEHWAFPVGFGSPAFVGDYQAWSINSGSRRLLRRLVFQNGYLIRIQTLDRGVSFKPGSRRCRPADLEKAGNTISEIYAHCGEPDFIYDESPVLQRPISNIRLPVFVANRVRWVYTFRRANDRELTFQDGRLQFINKLRR